MLLSTLNEASGCLRMLISLHSPAPTDFKLESLSLPTGAFVYARDEDCRAVRPTGRRIYNGSSSMKTALLPFHLRTVFLG
jgi:hypothetical protein